MCFVVVATLALLVVPPLLSFCFCCQIECDAISQRAFALLLSRSLTAFSLCCSPLLLSRVGNTLALIVCDFFKASQKVDNAFVIVTAHLQCTTLNCLRFVLEYRNKTANKLEKN